MEHFPSEGHYHLATKNSYTDDLAAWTEAAFDLFINFKKVRSCLSQVEIMQQAEPLQSNYIGQCSREQLVTLATAMQTELDTLFDELEQLSKPSQADRKKDHSRLVTHTATLNHLNQRAKTTLLLTKLSAT